ncbi:YeeE/YedE family protein [Inmirania thermothiophila]|uniref:YeeE/YedE family protein n=1 Tax=Inmirania thermothiophila TaxID=1750597 RepID=UPI001B877E0A|nr:YeeE/YedE family protein [Inmirania thermothiophila]
MTTGRIRSALPFAAAAALTALGLHVLWRHGPRLAALYAIALALGLALHHASFSFSGAYRALFTERRTQGVRAHILLIALATVLFAPFLAMGQAFGHPLYGALAPLSLSVPAGAFLFGIGMQIGDGCASGTLYTAGSGNRKMALTLAGFLAGSLLATFHAPFWWGVPSLGTVDLGRTLGWPAAVALQLGVLGLLDRLLVRIDAGRRPQPLQAHWLRGPWPLAAGAAALALLNLATLLVSGHAWTIAWGLTLWAGKIATALGLDLTAHAFWRGGYTEAALGRSILADDTSLMDLGIILGATLGAMLAGRFPEGRWPKARPLLGALVGGVLMGYGARIAFGCNIGALFSGLASFSLHGWVWIAAALPGVWVGIHLRPLFGLSGFPERAGAAGLSTR